MELHVMLVLYTVMAAQAIRSVLLVQMNIIFHVLITSATIHVPHLLTKMETRVMCVLLTAMSALMPILVQPVQTDIILE